MTDQHNFRALSCAGHSTVETPNIDRLAGDGVRFDRAYSPAPSCGPARAALFTGRYPREVGIEGNQDSFDSEVRLLPEIFRDAGYHTGLIGKLHFSPKAATHGFVNRDTHDGMYDVYHEEEPWTSNYVRWFAEERVDGDIEAVVKRANEDERAFKDRNSLYQFLVGSN